MFTCTVGLLSGFGTWHGISVHDPHIHDPGIQYEPPWDTAPRYLLRDRDSIDSVGFQHRIKNIGIEEVKITPRSPWQNPYGERLIGSLRRDVLDHVIVLNDRHLRRVLTAYISYYHRFRTHLSLAMDCPQPRAVEPPEVGKVMALPEVGGLHHHYERQAA